MADGTIKISARIDSKQLGKDLQDLQKDIESQGVNVDKALSHELNKVILEYQKYAEELEEKIQLSRELEQDIIRGTAEGASEWDKAGAILAVEDLKRITPEVDNLKVKMEGVVVSTEKLRDKLKETKEETTGVAEETKKIEKQSRLNLKQLVKYGGYMLGIRSAYRSILKATNAWFRSSEEGMQAQRELQGIWLSLGQTIAPIIQFMIKGLKTILGYVNAITKGLFGFALFTTGANAGMKKLVGSAKELRKQLAGFDEMNVLQDSSGGGSEDSGIPDFNIEEPDLSWLDKWKPKIDKLVDSFKKLWDVLKDLGGFIWENFIEGLKQVDSFLESMDINTVELIASIMLLYGAFMLIKALAGMNTLGWVIIGIIAIITAIGWLSKNWDMLKEKFGHVIKDMSDWLNGFLEKLGIFGFMIQGYAEDIWIFLKRQVKDSLMFFSGIIDFILGVFTADWTRAWKGLGKIVESIWNTVINLLQLPLNFIISNINSFLRWLNSFKVPDWVPIVGGKSVNIPLIPKLAQGAVVTGATTAMIGEAGREVVLPLDNNTEWARDLANILNEQGGVGGEIVNIIQIDGKEVSRHTRKLNQEEIFNTNGRGLKYGY